MAAAGALAHECLGARPAHPSVAHVSALHRPVPGRARPCATTSPRASSPRCRRSPTRWRRPGFRTGAFVSSVVLSRQSGLARGFATYSDRFEIGEDDARFLNTIQKRGDGPTAEAIAWLQQNAGAGALLRCGCTSTIRTIPTSRRSPTPRATRAGPTTARWRGRTSWSARLDAALTASGSRDNTLLVVTSDHGEGLGEHGESVHGYFVYESTLRVPLLLRGPGVCPAALRRAPRARSTCLPTALDLLGMAQPARTELSGRSLAPRAARRRRSRAASRPTPSRWCRCCTSAGATCARCATGASSTSRRRGRSSTTCGRIPASCKTSRRASRRKAEALRGALAQWLAAEKARARTAAPRPRVPPELLEKLGALGYVGAGTRPAGAATGADPKDKLEDYKVVNRLMREGLVALREQRPQDSVARFAELQKRGIESFEVHYYLARALAQTRALPRRRRALRGSAGAAAGLRCRLRRHSPMPGSRWGTAPARSRHCSAARRRRPRDSQLPLARGAHLPPPGAARKTRSRAYEAARRAGAEERARAGAAGRDVPRRGPIPAMRIRLLREAVALDRHAGVLLELARHGAGRPGATGGSREGVPRGRRRDGKDPLYNYNLGLALLRQSRAADARALVPQDARPCSRRSRLQGNGCARSVPARRLEVDLRPEHGAARVDDVGGTAEVLRGPQPAADVLVGGVVDRLRTSTNRPSLVVAREREVLLHADVEHVRVRDPQRAVDRLDRIAVLGMPRSSLALIVRAEGPARLVDEVEAHQEALRELVDELGLEDDRPVRDQPPVGVDEVVRVAGRRCRLMPLWRENGPSRLEPRRPVERDQHERRQRSASCSTSAW